MQMDRSGSAHKTGSLRVPEGLYRDTGAASGNYF